MGTLEGRLSPAAFRSVLEALGKAPEATWIVSDARDAKVVHVSPAGIQLQASAGRRIAAGVEDFLVERQRITPQQLVTARETFRVSGGEPIEDVFERLGFLPRAEFREALSRLIYLEICDIAAWEDAFFEVREGTPSPELLDPRRPFLAATTGLSAIADRLLRWAGEWESLRGQFGSERVQVKLVVPTEHYQGPRLPGLSARWHRAVDGVRTLRALAIAAGSDFPDLARAVHEGLRGGSLKAAPVAAKERTRTEVLAEVERLEEAVDRSHWPGLIRRKIAALYEALGDRDRASEQIRIAGDGSRAAGRTSEAAARYGEAVSLCPWNLAARESLIWSFREAGDEAKACAEAIASARNLLAWGLPGRAEAELRPLPATMLRRPEVRLILADAHAAEGRKAEALKEYLAVVDERRRAGSTEGIDETCKKVLAISPANPAARACLQRGIGRRAVKVLRQVHRGSIAAAATLLLAWLVSEGTSRIVWAHSENGIRRDVASGLARDGIDGLRAIGKTYPGSLLIPSLLERERALFREAFLRHEADIERADALWKGGSLDDARALYGAVASSSAAAPQIMRAQDGLRMVESTDSLAEDIRRRSEELLGVGRYEDAFEFSRLVLDRYPQAAGSLRLPIYIRTAPPGAEVKVNGLAWGRTPVWVVASLQGTPKITVELPGFRPASLNALTALRSPEVDLTFEESR